MSSIVALFCCFRNDNLKSVSQQVDLRSVSTAGIYKTTIYKRPEHLVYNLVADPIDTKAEMIEKIKLQIDALLEELSKLEE